MSDPACNFDEVVDGVEMSPSPDPYPSPTSSTISSSTGIIGPKVVCKDGEDDGETALEPAVDDDDDDDDVDQLGIKNPDPDPDPDPGAELAPKPKPNPDPGVNPGLGVGLANTGVEHGLRRVSVRRVVQTVNDSEGRVDEEEEEESEDEFEDEGGRSRD
jgi:hypothetical protein